MRLTILGSGTLFPTKERQPSSFLLEAQGAKILIDCGHEAISGLIGLGIDPREIDGVFISHFHIDHFGDAFNLVHSRFVGDLYQKKNHRKIIFWGPKTISERFKKWREIYWVEPEENYPVEFNEGAGRYSFGNLTIETYPVHHVPYYESIGLRLAGEGKTLAYPGDVGSEQDFNLLVGQAKEADLLLIEAGSKESSPNHFTIEQIRELAERAKAKRTAIIHIKPAKEDQVRVENFVKENQGFIMGEDKMVIEL